MNYGAPCAGREERCRNAAARRELAERRCECARMWSTRDDDISNRGRGECMPRCIIWICCAGELLFRASMDLLAGERLLGLFGLCLGTSGVPKRRTGCAIGIDVYYNVILLRNEEVSIAGDELILVGTMAYSAGVHCVLSLPEELIG